MVRKNDSQSLIVIEFIAGSSIDSRKGVAPLARSISPLHGQSAVQYSMCLSIATEQDGSVSEDTSLIFMAVRTGPPCNRFHRSSASILTHEPLLGTIYEYILRAGIEA